MGYLDEVKEQGAALRAAVEAYRGAEGARLLEAARLVGSRPVLFVGMGSSWAAALAAEAHLAASGRAAFAVDASEALYRWLPVLRGPGGPAPVLISQSGESKEVVGLAERLPSPPIVLTNEPGSTLARRAAVVLPLHAGSEKGTCNKTFVNTLAVLGLLGRAVLAARPEGKAADPGRLLGISEFVEAAAALDALLERCRPEVPALQVHLGEPHPPGAKGPVPLPWEIIGRGSGLAAVEQGALVLRELTGRVLVPSAGGLFRHGAVYRTGPSTRAIVLAAEAEEGKLLLNLAEEILSRGGRVAILSDFDPGIASPRAVCLRLPAVGRPLFSTAALVPLEVLGVADAEARGYDSETGVPKVTTVE
jgi:glutamine---fructose-6-phosphate transaminase (isomerizing)